MSKINLDNYITNSIIISWIIISCITLIVICIVFLYSQYSTSIKENMESKPTFKLKDIITNKYISINRDKNKSILDDKGIDLYIDNSSNFILNIQSGAVGLVDYVNNNYMQQLNGKISTSNKIIANPSGYVKSSDFELGNLNFSWIFCASDLSPNYYSIYNNGKWLNIDGEDISFNNTKRLWYVDGDNNQVMQNSIKYVISFQDVISGRMLNVNRTENKAILSQYPTYFMFNDIIVNDYYTEYKTYILQDMYDGSCLTSVNDIIVTENFSMDNPTFGWLLFKTDTANTYNIYNRSKNKWINTNGKDINSSSTPSNWKIDGKTLSNMIINEAAYKIQEKITGKYINIDNNTNLAYLDEKGATFCDVFVNGKDINSGQYICNISTGNYLTYIENNILETKFDKSKSNDFIFSFYNVNDSDFFTIFKPMNGVTKDDAKNAKYMDYSDTNVTLQSISSNDKQIEGFTHTSSSRASVKSISNSNSNSSSSSKTTPMPSNNSTNTTTPMPSNNSENANMSEFKSSNTAVSNDNTSLYKTDSNYKSWKKVFVFSMKEGFANMDDIRYNKIENFGTPMPGMPALKSPMDALSTVQNSDFSPISNMIPAGPSGSKPDSNVLINVLTDSVSNAAMPTEKPMKSVVSLDSNNGESSFNYNGPSSFTSPQDLNISTSSKFDDIIDATNQYITISMNGDFALSSNKKQNKPLGNRYFIDTKTMCNKKDGTGKTERYMLVDNMKYMKYPDGTTNTKNYGLLYSTAGTLQEIDSNTLLSQYKVIDDINSPMNLCVKVEVDLDGNNNKFDSKYVTVSDCKKIDAIAFKDGKSTCEGFDNYTESYEKKIIINDDIVTKFYFTSITVVCLFILYKFIDK